MAAIEGRRGALMDQEIEQQLAAGRHDRAFDLVVGAYKDRVFRLALSILRERAAAEDAAQETFVRIWKALPALRRSRCAWHLDLRDHAQHLPDGAAAQPPDGVAGRPGFARTPSMRKRSIASGPAADPERDNLLRLLAQLPRNQQEAVRLFYLEDRSYEAVAESLGMPLGTVKNLLHRARKRLDRARAPGGGQGGMNGNPANGRLRGL